jgi:protease-4
MSLAIASYAIYDGLIKAPTGAISDSGDSYCNVVGINLHGMLATYIPTQGSADDPEEYQTQYGDAVGSEDIVSTIRGADQDDTIKAIIMEVDSSGGYPVAGEEIADALKQSTKPTVVVIRQSGLSAAYWASTGAEQIFASKNSDVGSIGVTSSYLDNVGKNQKDGNAYVQLSSGKYKDAGNPDKSLTEEERQLFLRDIKITHENFIEAVANNRNIPVEQVKAIADGSSVLGEKAKSLNLIDQIGGWPEAEKYIEQQIGEKPEICWY